MGSQVMNYIKLLKTQKTLFALAFVGMYGTSLLSSNHRVQAASARPEFSTLTRTQLSTSSRLVMPGQAIVKLPLYNSNIRVQSTQSRLGVQVADSSENPDLNRGRPSGSDRGAGTRAINTDDVPDRGRPGDPGRGAGSRGGQSCPRADKPLTTLMPVTPKSLVRGQELAPEKKASDSRLGLTVAERPIFWFYIPYSLTSEHPIEFVLQDDKNNDIYQTTLTEQGTSPGIVGFELPSTAPALEVNKTYRWYFYIYCTADRTDDPTFVEGWVKRVSINPSLKRQLEQAKPQQRFELYAKAGIWHEAVTSLAELRRKNPEDASLKNEWTTLLEAMNLEAIAKEPIRSLLMLTAP